MYRISSAVTLGYHLPLQQKSITKNLKTQGEHGIQSVDGDRFPSLTTKNTMQNIRFAVVVWDPLSPETARLLRPGIRAADAALGAPC